MQITGLFTIDEIESAIKTEAKFERLRGGQQSLTFKSESDYKKWLNYQKENHADRWSQLITIKPKS